MSNPPPFPPPNTPPPPPGGPNNPYGNNPYGQNPYGNNPYNNPYQQNPMGMQRDVPNATAILVLGIVSIVGCFCYGIIGLGCGIAALIMASKAMQEYNQNPSMFKVSSYNNAKAGRICAIIGTIISGLTSLWWICLVVLGIGGSYYSNPYNW